MAADLAQAFVLPPAPQAAPGLLAMRVDFAHLVGTSLIVYGWVAGLSESVASARLVAGDRTVDLLTDAVRLQRRDVTQNFHGRGLAGDDHGFIVLLDLAAQDPANPLADPPAAPASLRLIVELQSGESGESEWPVAQGVESAVATLRAHEGMLRPLIPRLGPRQLRVLAGIGAPAPLTLRADDLQVAADGASAGLPVHVQLCCVVADGVLVVGGVAPRPCDELEALDLSIPYPANAGSAGSVRIDLLDGLVTIASGPTAPQRNVNPRGPTYLASGFLQAARVDDIVDHENLAAARVVTLRVSGPHGDAATRVVLCTDERDAWQRFAAHLASVDANARIAFLERIAAIRAAPTPKRTPGVPALTLARGGPSRSPSAPIDGLAQKLADKFAGPQPDIPSNIQSDAQPDALAQLMARAVHDLPGHLDANASIPFADASIAVTAQPAVRATATPAKRVMMLIDRLIVAGSSGIFLTGWFHADPVDDVQVSCRGPGGEFRLDDQWTRLPRPDVVTHLAAQGVVSTDQPGFSCFVPLPPGAWPHYLAISCGAGASARTWRLRLPQPSVGPVLQSIRAVLGTLEPSRDDLRHQLEQHLGPTVAALWGARAPRRREVLERFGPQPAEPRVSVIVPLFGRHDLADYQLALFADDRDFQSAELIYVVDDPAIFDAFRAACADLYGLYRVPFTLAYAGDNLGFAGATNHGASLARAPHLLLLNSDVMPKQSGWLAVMLDIHRASADRGVLGAKLLYEDGTVQHAGMSSRRNPQWQGLWINHHPHKGLSPAGLGGIREVEAVTAACALVDTVLYRALGGLSEDYIVGDFEDSDFCHRVRRNGRRNRVALDVTLYHLERQSQLLAGDASFRRSLTLYNCWLHDQRWGASLAKAEAASRTAG